MSVEKFLMRMAWGRIDWQKSSTHGICLKTVEGVHGERHRVPLEHPLPPPVGEFLYEFPRLKLNDIFQPRVAIYIELRILNEMNFVSSGKMRCFTP